MIRVTTDSQTLLEDQTLKLQIWNNRPHIVHQETTTLPPSQWKQSLHQLKHETLHIVGGKTSTQKKAEAQEESKSAADDSSVFADVVKF